jgi:succinate dehydrogenase / fumarate reductase iron-sulfur subunit
MKLILNIWRQSDRNSKGRFKEYKLRDLNPDMSLFEALDYLNEELLSKDEDTIEFDP